MGLYIKLKGGKETITKKNCIARESSTFFTYKKKPIVHYSMGCHV